MADNKQIVMEIPAEIISAQVKAAVVQALSGTNPQRFVEALVVQVLNEKAPDSYGRQTILDKTLSKMVQDVAKQFIGEWVEEAKPLIRAELDRRMRKNPKQFAIDVADKVVEAMKGHMYVNVKIGNDN